MSRTGKALRILLVMVAVLAVVAVGVLWFRHTYEKVEKQIPLPARGEAAYNPLYALKRALQADGLNVDSRQRLDLAAHTLAAGDTVLVFGDPRNLNPVEVRRLLDWVAGGGHLVVRSPPPERWEKQSQAPLLQTLGVRLLPNATACEPLQVEGEDHHVEFCTGRRFTFNGIEPLLSWGDLASGYVHARLAHGRGQVDVLADFDFLTNDGGRPSSMFSPDEAPLTGGLRDGPHLVLARNVLAPNYGRGTMHLVYSAKMPSLLSSVVRQGWPVWAPLLLALLIWLWSRAQRFGPWLPAPQEGRRSLLEHVRASGEHLSRYNRRVLLYAAARNAFLSHLRRRDPLIAALQGEPQVEALANRFELPVAAVRTALQVPSPHDRQGFRDRVSTLIQMRNRL